jgi:hypothetical protein
MKASKSVLEASRGIFQAIPSRNITLETVKAYGVTVTDDKHYYPYGTGFKVRTVKDKT